MKQILLCDLKNQDVNKAYHCPEEPSCTECSQKIPKPKSNLFKDNPPKEKTVQAASNTPVPDQSFDHEHIKTTLLQIKKLHTKLTATPADKQKP
ncbi:MAG: hypothetical protein GY868_01050 [Deltaproteobacteria bacterium]|nr:hypothetical protein [Deltaproteobacteria bacterium]